MELIRLFRDQVVGRIPERARKQVTALLPGPVARWYGHVALDSYDTYIISPPKAGRTWLRVMLGRALQLHFGLPDGNILELHALGARHPGVPKVLVSHDDDMLLSGKGGATESKAMYQGKNVLFLARDPRDTFISTYFHNKVRYSDMKGDPSISEWIARTDYFDRLIRFYNIWAENRHVPATFMLVRYEDMHENGGRELRRVLDFLGVTDIASATVEEAVGFASFANMRKMEEQDQFNSFRLRPGQTGVVDSYKTRRGEVGGFKSYLSPPELERLNDLMRANLSDFYGYEI